MLRPRIAKMGRLRLVSRSGLVGAAPPSFGAGLGFEFVHWCPRGLRAHGEARMFDQKLKVLNRAGMVCVESVPSLAKHVAELTFVSAAAQLHTHTHTLGHVLNARLQRHRWERRRERGRA